MLACLLASASHAADGQGRRGDLRAGLQHVSSEFLSIHDDIPRYRT